MIKGIILAEGQVLKIDSINAEQLTELTQALLKSGYGKHLLEII
jgi:hypothetical protein